MRERIIRSWCEIAEYLGVSEKTVRAWYHGYGGAQDPCGLRGAVVRLSPRLMVARESALQSCWERLYPLPNDTTQHRTVPPR